MPERQRSHSNASKRRLIAGDQGSETLHERGHCPDLSRNWIGKAGPTLSARSEG
ncbi:hypothetical protein [Mangrovicoccus ximenensis]|uniref:hypothetical protein n=1 Tax=Mangrovicoccus ximenensis TaxID=1911570 RepID=UPI001374EC64|nr:hypothetical protein [Mangrovicoccus ximenensis]